MKPLYIAAIAALALLSAACQDDSSDTAVPRSGIVSFITTVAPFHDEAAPAANSVPGGSAAGSASPAGSASTRATLDGQAFREGDRIKLKVICPYSRNTEFCETTYGNSIDAFWIMKWKDNDWKPITTEDKVDITGTYSFGSAPSIYGQYEAQQTPYVYTAQTWTQNILFIAPSAAGGKAATLYTQYSYIFQADQREEADYLACDLLWAQEYMQTGSYNVHLSFEHKMACLKIQVNGTELSEKAVVTLEGMPDIDQREVVVGDYYAARSKVNARYGYQEKCTCAKAYNGRVLGVAVVNDALARAQVYPMSGNPGYDATAENIVENSGTYTAHRESETSSTFYLIVPPCELTDNAKFWIRDGSTRHSYKLSRTVFEEGKLYPVNITLK